MFRRYLHTTRAQVALRRAAWSEATDAATLVLHDPGPSIIPRIYSWSCSAWYERGEAILSPRSCSTAQRCWPSSRASRIRSPRWPRREPSWPGSRGGPRHCRGDGGRARATRCDTTPGARPASCAAGGGAPACVRPCRAFPGRMPRRSRATGIKRPALGRTWLPVRGCAGARRCGRRRCTRARPGRVAPHRRAPRGGHPHQRLRERGVRRVPRGPDSAARENPASLTSRELEVLALVTDGLRNADIAARLVVSRANGRPSCLGRIAQARRAHTGRGSCHRPARRPHGERRLIRVPCVNIRGQARTLRA